MCTACGECCIQFAGGHQMLVEKRTAHGFRGSRQVVDHRVARTDSDQERSIVNIFQASALRKPIESSREVHDIGAHGGEGLRDCVPQPVPGRMRWIAVQGRNVRLLQCDGSPRARQLDHLPKQSRGLARRACYKAHMDQIEAGARKPRAVGVAGHKLDIHAAARALAGIFQKNRIGVEANDPSRRAGAGAKQIDYAARSAAKVETAPAGSDADLVEHCRRVGGEGIGLNPKSLNLSCPPGNRIVTRSGRFPGFRLTHRHTSRIGNPKAQVG